MSLIKSLAESKIGKLIYGGLVVATLGIFYNLVNPNFARAEEQNFSVTNSRKPSMPPKEENYNQFPSYPVASSRKPNVSFEGENHKGLTPLIIAPRGEKRIIKNNPSKNSNFSKRFDEFISYVAGNPENLEEGFKVFGIRYENSPYGSDLRYGTYGPKKSFEDKWALCDEFALLSIASLPNIESFYVVYGNKKAIFPHAISLLKQNETYGYISNGHYVGGFGSRDEAITNSNVFFKNDEHFWYEVWKFNPKSLRDKGKIDLPKDATLLYSKP